jgi:hypothetical protein
MTIAQYSSQAAGVSPRASFFMGWFCLYSLLWNVAASHLPGCIHTGIFQGFATFFQGFQGFHLDYSTEAMTIL